MKKNTPTAQRKRAGFTLIEVLIVVGIIGLLASVILSGLNSARARARDARRVADLRQVQQGLELYYTKCQHYPGSQDCGTGAPSNWEGLRSTLTGAGLGISGVPNDPLYGGESGDYKYGVAANGQGYVLQATLEDENSTLFKDSYDQSLPSGFNANGIDCQDANSFCLLF